MASGRYSIQLPVNVLQLTNRVKVNFSLRSKHIYELILGSNFGWTAFLM